MPLFPAVRMRRLRKSESLRNLMRENTLNAHDFIYPIFVEEGGEDHAPIASMPGISRIPEKKLAADIKAMYADGIRAIVMFGVSNHKDETGSDSWKEDGLVTRMIKRAKDAVPDIVVISDTCFCEYTTHGHCGVIDDGQVHNDMTLDNLAKQAVMAARAGADMIAPSAMMDGQIAAIRKALDEAAFTDTSIMAYSSKFASGFYGPFRAAAGCDLKGDRFSYQMDSMNGREAIRESLIDEKEGADILMVKPGLPYLDVLAKIREQSLLPLAVYQVSGEYAMIKFAAQAGAIDEKRVVRETLGAFKRAGADLIISYYARDFVRGLI